MLSFAQSLRERPRGDKLDSKRFALTSVGWPGYLHPIAPVRVFIGRTSPMGFGLTLSLAMTVCLLASPAAEQLNPTDTVRRPEGLSVHDIQLERGPFIDLAPTTDLSFALSNDTASSFKDIVLEVSLVRGTPAKTDDGERTVLAGPVVVRASVELQAGFTMAYVMRMRNFAAECDCHAVVDVVSATVVKPQR